MWELRVRTKFKVRVLNDVTDLISKFSLNPVVFKMVISQYSPATSS
jgi:hypothetical protein